MDLNNDFLFKIAKLTIIRYITTSKDNLIAIAYEKHGDAILTDSTIQNIHYTISHRSTHTE